MSVKLSTIKKKIKKNKDVEDKTVDSYVKNLEMVLNKYLYVKTNQNAPFNLSVLYDFDKIKKKLNTIKPATRANYLIAIVVTLRQYASARKKMIKVGDKKLTVVEAYSHYLSATNREVGDRYDQHTLNKDEKDNWIGFENVIKKREQLKKDIKINFNKLKKIPQEERQEYLSKNFLVRDVDKVQEWVVLCYYTYLPPQRNDAATLIVIRGNDPIPPNVNYILMRDKKIVIKEYKTRRSRERKQKREGTSENLDVIIDIPPDLYKAMQKWLLVNQTDFFLINCRKNTPMSKNNLTKFMQKIFAPKKVSTSLLRKMYWHFTFPLLENRVKMKEQARLMMHSYAVADQVYRKAIEQGGGGFGDFCP